MRGTNAIGDNLDAMTAMLDGLTLDELKALSQNTQELVTREEPWFYILDGCAVV